MRNCACPVCGRDLPDTGLTIIPERQIAVSGGGFVVLTPHEIEVLAVLAEKFPRVVTKAQIMDRLYGMSGEEPAEKIVDVYVCKLRAKVKAIGIKIDTARGVGFSLGVPAEILQPQGDDL